MYKNLLVPVSFEAGRDAHKAIEIANAIREPEGKITILHVLEHLPQYASDLLPEDHVETARKIVADKLAPLASDSRDTDVVIVEGHSARTIIDYAENHQIDCIIITSHQPSVQDMFLGSTSARVARHARCAVHIVR